MIDAEAAAWRRLAALKIEMRASKERADELTVRAMATGRADLFLAACQEDDRLMAMLDEGEVLLAFVREQRERRTQ